MIKKISKMMIAVAIGSIIISCNDNDDDQYTHINKNNLPATAKIFLEENFSGIDAQSIIKLHIPDNDGTRYEVDLLNKTEIDFDDAGNWTSVDGNNQKIPSGFINENIVNYIENNYPSFFIESIDRSYNTYEVELWNGPDLIFNQNGNFVTINY